MTSPIMSPTIEAKPSFRRGFIIAAIAGVFMAMIGALGTDVVSLPARLAYWLTVMVGARHRGSVRNP